MIAAYVIPSVVPAYGQPVKKTSWTAVTRSYRKLIDRATEAREHSGEAMPGSLGNISG
jgi:hypothetical protein